jgi:hypothetical protein
MAEVHDVNTKVVISMLKVEACVRLMTELRKKLGRIEKRTRRRKLDVDGSKESFV